MILDIVMLVNLTNVLDLQSTVNGLKKGLKEVNPFAKYILEKAGVQGLATVKIGSVLLFSVMTILTESKALARLLVAMGIVFALAAMNNITLIALKRT